MTLLCSLSGPRCKVTDDGSFIYEAEPQGEQHLRFGENTTGTGQCFSIQNREDVLVTAWNTNLNRANIPKNESCGRPSCEMITKGVVRNPRDPFDFHVYIGSSPETSAMLKSKLNLRCCFRGGEQIIDKQNKKKIKHNIMCSEKCIMFITPEYIKDSWFETEMNAATKKARRFSRDMLFVLKDSKVPDEKLNIWHLYEFQTATVNDVMLPNQLISWLRQDAELIPIIQLSGEILGYFAAFVYYYGFLNLVLKDHRQQMKSQVQSSLEVAQTGAKVVLPMLIVVPESHQVPKSFDVEGKITTCHEYVVTISHRGGSMNRDFKRSVTKLVVDSGRNDFAYFTGNFPAILLTIYETNEASQMGLTKKQLDEIRKDFCRTLQSLLCHPDNQHCVDQYRLVLWPDRNVDLYDFLLQIVCNTAEEGEASSLVVNASQSHGVKLTESSFSRQESSNINLRKLSGASEPYDMHDVSPRGICLIINISDVMPTSNTDVQQLHTLFSEQFDFEVRDKFNVGKMTWDRLNTLLHEVAQEDHSHYDAFVCYLASRGQLGNVYTSNETSNSVNSAITLVNFFTHECVSLYDKPKLFLIHMTDDGTTNNSTSDDTISTQVLQFILTIATTLAQFCKVYVSIKQSGRSCVKYCSVFSKLLTEE